MAAPRTTTKNTASKPTQEELLEAARVATFAALEAYEGTDKFLVGLKEKASDPGLSPNQLNAAYKQLVLGIAHVPGFRNYDPDGEATITCIDRECDAKVTGTRKQIGAEFKNRCPKHRV